MASPVAVPLPPLDLDGSATRAAARVVPGMTIGEGERKGCGEAVGSAVFGERAAVRAGG